jgi:AcrR family transcriptional regulator
MELYVSRGFEKTTAADIAQSVGLTERTFFRYFADKREVLFAGQDLLEQGFVKGVAEAPPGASPLEVIEAALSVAATFFPDERRAYSRQRHTVISANAALQERELLKMASLASAVAAALRARDVPEPAATLAAASGVTVFSVAFGQWIAEGEQRSFVDLEHEVLAELETLAAGPARAAPLGHDR